MSGPSGGPGRRSSHSSMHDIFLRLSRHHHALDAMDMDMALALSSAQSAASAQPPAAAASASSASTRQVQAAAKKKKKMSSKPMEDSGSTESEEDTDSSSEEEDRYHFEREKHIKTLLEQEGDRLDEHEVMYMMEASRRHALLKADRDKERVAEREQKAKEKKARRERRKKEKAERVARDAAKAATSATAAASAASRIGALSQEEKARNRERELKRQEAEKLRLEQQRQQREREQSRRRSHRDTFDMMDMHYMRMMGRHRYSPPPKKHWEIVEEKLAAAMRNRNKDEVKLQLEEWVKLKDMPEQRQFNLEQYCKDAMRGLNGQGLIKEFVEKAGMMLFTERDISNPYFTRTADMLAPKLEYGINTGRGGGGCYYHDMTREWEDFPFRGHPTHDAVFAWKPAYIRELLDNGATLAPAFEFRATYMHVACMRPDRNTNLGRERLDDFTATVDILLENGVEIDAPDERGMTPLHIICLLMLRRSSEYTYEYTRGLFMVNALLERGADPFKSRQDGPVSVSPFAEHLSPFHCAVERGNVAFIQALCKGRRRLNMPPPAPRLLGPGEVADLKAATMLAAENQHLEVLEHLMAMQIDPIDVQANALELIGAKMSVSRIKPGRDVDPREVLHAHVIREDRCVHAFSHFMRRAARLRARHGITVKHPPVDPVGIRFAQGTVREPTTVAELNALGISEFDDLMAEDSIQRQGVMHAVAIMVHIRLFEIRNRWCMYYPNKSIKRMGQVLLPEGKYHVQDFIGAMLLSIKMLNMWKRPLVERFSLYEELLLSIKALRAVLENCIITRTSKCVLAPMLEWLAYGQQRLYHSGYLTATFLDNVNRMFYRTAHAWPRNFHDGRRAVLANYADPAFMRFAATCNRLPATPLHPLLERTSRGSDRDRYYFFHDKYIFDFQPEHLSLVRLWLANGVDHHRRTEAGELPIKLNLKEIKSQESYKSHEDSERLQNLYMVRDLIFLEQDDAADKKHKSRDEIVYQ